MFCSLFCMLDNSGKTGEDVLTLEWQVQFLAHWLHDGWFCNAFTMLEYVGYNIGQ